MIDAKFCHASARCWPKFFLTKFWSVLMPLSSSRKDLKIVGAKFRDMKSVWFQFCIETFRKYFRKNNPHHTLIWFTVMSSVKISKWLLMTVISHHYFKKRANPTIFVSSYVFQWVSSVNFWSVVLLFSNILVESPVWNQVHLSR